jgi:O-antigen/teichoic acid export membrane protein
MSHVDKYTYALFISLSALLGIFKITLFAKLLGPEQYGLYALVLSVYIFIVYFGSMGLNDALIKLGSKAFGQSKLNDVYDLHILAAVYGGIVTFVLGTLFSISIIIFLSDEDVSIVLALAGLLAFSALEFNLLNALLRVTHRFVFYSVLLFVKSLGIILLGWYLALDYGAFGVVLAEIIAFSLVFLVAYSMVVRSVSLKDILSRYELVIFAIRNGFPMMLANVVRNLALSADKWILASSLGVAAVGKYAFAMILYTISMFLLGFLTTVLGPRWLASYSNDNDIKKLLRSVLRFSSAWFLLLLFAAIPAYLLLPILIENFFVEYNDRDTLLATSIIYIGVMFLVPSFFLDWFFIAISFETKVLSIAISMMVLSMLLLGICWYLELSIVAYAVVFTAARIYVFLSYMRVVFSLKRQDFVSESN